MRYYNIDITGSQSGQQTTYSSLITGGNSATSLVAALQSALSPAGATDPNALDIELNIWTSPYFITEGGGQNAKSWVRIHGIPLINVAQQSDLNGATIQVSAGMATGLPLASAAASQAGILVNGVIRPAYGNWIDTDMTLDLILSPPTGGLLYPKNLSGIWKQGTQLSNAIQSTLHAAFPAWQPKMNIGTNLVLNYDVPFSYGTLQQFSQFVYTISKSINKSSTYQGVQISQNGNSIYVYDGTGGPSAQVVQIQFQDLIGQPTWSGDVPNTINFKTVMRGDLLINSTVQMPNAIVVQNPLSSLNPSGQPSFSGQWVIQSANHLGHYRQPDASSWVSVFTAIPSSSTLNPSSSASAIY